MDDLTPYEVRALECLLHADDDDPHATPFPESDQEPTE